MQNPATNSVYVLVAAKINKPLAYSIGHLASRPTPGSLVRVPLASRIVTGIVIDDTDTKDKPGAGIKLKPVSAVLPEDLNLSRELIALLSWCQRYYHVPMGQVIQAALPKSILNGKPSEAKSKNKWIVSADQTTIDTLSATRQKALMQWLNTNQPANTAEILAAGFGRHLLTALEKKKLIQPIDSSLANQSENTERLKEQPQPLNPEQERAVQTICAKNKKNNPLYLLNGVTGSGKTEVYLQTAFKHLQNGKKVLVLVPEIGLVEQTAGRFHKRFRVELLTYHSSTAESEKLYCWKRVRQKGPMIVVGTRSSIFLPFEELSLLVVDEEQDLSYKQQEGFRYNARDLAVVRATQEATTLLLGSATASLESLNNVNRGLFRPLYLKKRIGDRPLPGWKFCKPATRENNRPISDTALQTIGQHIEQKNQVLVFINRRGFAPLLQCSHCGWQAKCSACETAMTLHRQPVALICHRCDRRQSTPQHCPDCKSTQLKSLGLGTEQLESFLQKAFTHISCLRVDRDSTQRKGSFSAKLSRLAEGQPAILIGTQMITKGHHLPGIALVVVLDADSALLSHDFRSLEHLSQSLIQVAGRAGRGQTMGEVLIETSRPDHPVFKALESTSYQAFSKQLLEARNTQNLPPYCFSALLHASSTDFGLLNHFMEHCRQTLFQHAANLSNHKDMKIEFIGPMPSPTEKRNNRFRQQIQIYANSRSQLHSAISSVEQMVDRLKGFTKIRFAIDIDPLTMD